MNSKNVKIVVFVPETHTDLVLEVAGKEGSGIIGNYSFCSFRTRGVGRFKPEKGSNPYIGHEGEFEEVEEERIEFVCSREKLKEVVSAIKKVHPYDEVALDIYPLEDIE